MSTAVTLRDIIGVTKNIFLEAIVPLQGYLNAGAVFPVSVEMHNFVYSAFVGIQILNKGFKAAIIGINFFLTRALVMKNNTHTGVKERQLAQSLGQLIKMEFNISKRTLRRCEIHLCTTRLSITNNRQWRHGNTMLIGLLMDFTVTTDSQAHLLG